MKAYILKELTLGSVVPFGNVCFNFHVHRRIDQNIDEQSTAREQKDKD